MRLLYVYIQFGPIFRKDQILQAGHYLRIALALVRFSWSIFFILGTGVL